MKTRHAYTWELPEVFDLLIKFHDEFDLGYDYDKDRGVATLARLIESCSGAVYVVADESGIYGAIGVMENYSPFVGKIYQEIFWYAAPAIRSNLCAGKLLVLAEKWVKSKGGKSIKMVARHDMGDTKKMLLKRGYSEEETFYSIDL